MKLLALKNTAKGTLVIGQTPKALLNGLFKSQGPDLGQALAYSTGDSKSRMDQKASAELQAWRTSDLKPMDLKALGNRSDL